MVNKSEITDSKTSLNQFDSMDRIYGHAYHFKNKKWQCYLDQKANVHVFTKEYFGKNY